MSKHLYLIVLVSISLVIHIFCLLCWNIFWFRFWMLQTFPRLSSQGLEQMFVTTISTISSDTWRQIWLVCFAENQLKTLQLHCSLEENKLDFAYWSINGEKRSNESETYGLLQVLKLWLFSLCPRHCLARTTTLLWDTPGSLRCCKHWWKGQWARKRWKSIRLQVTEMFWAPLPTLGVIEQKLSKSWLRTWQGSSRVHRSQQRTSNGGGINGIFNVFVFFRCTVTADAHFILSCGCIHFHCSPSFTGPHGCQASTKPEADVREKLLVSGRA